MLSALDLTTIMPIAVLIAGGIFVYLILDFIFNRKSKTESRLEEMRTRMSGGTVEKKDKSGFASLLEKASPKMGEALQPKNEKEMSKQKQKLSYASAKFRNDAAPAMLSTAKMLSGIVGFFIGGGSSILINGFNTTSLVSTLVVAFLFMMIPDLVLSFMGKKRKEKVFLGLPDALDLMVVCVEAGLGMDQALRKVAEEMEKSHKEIGEEFGIANQQLQFGRTRSEVLQALGFRSGVDDLKQLSSILIQADKFGSSIATALRVQSDSMRTKRRQIAEEKAAKTAVKMIFPLVLFIFPGIFVVLVGPAGISMYRNMLSK